MNHLVRTDLSTACLWHLWALSRGLYPLGVVTVLVATIGLLVGRESGPAGVVGLVCAVVGVLTWKERP